MLWVLDEPSAPSGLLYIFAVGVQLLRFGSRRRQCQGSLSRDLSGRWKQSQAISSSCQRLYLFLRDGEISHLFSDLSFVTLVTEWLSASMESRTSTNVHVCYWAWKSSRTLYQSSVHFISVCSLSGLDIPCNFCKAKISSTVTACYWKIPQSTVLVKKSVKFLSLIYVLLLHLIPTIQHSLQRIVRSLTHRITTTWKTLRKFQVQFRTICIIICLVLLCTQLCMMAIRHTRAKHATSGTAVVLMVMCSLHFSQAHPTQSEINLATLHNSAMHRHTRENGMTSRTLTLRLTGGPNVGYCVTVAMGSVPQEVSQASA